MSTPITQVTIVLDQQALQTLKMALAALRLSANVVEVGIDSQVQQQLAAAQPQEPASPPANLQEIG